MAVYGSYTQSGSIIRLSDGASIPPDPRNSDYQQALAAIANGDTISAYVAPVIDLNAVDQQSLNDMLTAPGSVVRALALLMLARINAIDAAINALNVKTGLAGNNLPIFTQAQLIAALAPLMR